MRAVQRETIGTCEVFCLIREGRGRAELKQVNTRQSESLRLHRKARNFGIMGDRAQSPKRHRDLPLLLISDGQSLLRGLAAFFIRPGLPPDQTVAAVSEDAQEAGELLRYAPLFIEWSHQTEVTRASEAKQLSILRSGDWGGFWSVLPRPWPALLLPRPRGRPLF